MRHRLLGMDQDFIASVLRSQVRELNQLLNTLEGGEIIEEQMQSGLKQVEVNIRGLRKLYSVN